MGEINDHIHVKIYNLLKGVEVAFIGEIIVAMCTLTSIT